MLFVICLCLSVYLMYLEFKEYGKLVPASAITNETSIIKIVPLLVQRFTAAGVFSYLYSFFDQFNNFFSNLINFIFLIGMLYFGIKAIMIGFPLFFKIILSIWEQDHKPYE